MSSDKGTIMAGLGLFVAIVAFPVWYSAASTAPDRNGDGKPDYQPMPEKPEGQTACIESTEFMRASHMDLLMTWRDTVVREDQREWTAPDGKIYTISLTGTCLRCHDNKAEFCDRCHDYSGVTPYCWDCHVDPSSLTPLTRSRP